MFHLFHKYTRVCEDGYQYCTICGKAKVPPCIHQWKEKTGMDINARNGNEKWNIGRVYLYECTECKDTKQSKLLVPDNNGCW